MQLLDERTEWLRCRATCKKTELKKGESMKKVRRASQFKEALEESPWQMLGAFIAATIVVLSLIALLPPPSGFNLFTQEYLHKQLQGVAAITGSAVAIFLAVIAIRIAKLGSVSQSPEYESAYAAYLAVSDFILYDRMMKVHLQKNEALQTLSEYVPGTIVERVMQAVSKPEFGVLVRRLDKLGGEGDNVGPLQGALHTLVAQQGLILSNRVAVKELASAAEDLRDKVCHALTGLQNLHPDGSFDLHVKKMVSDMGVPQ